MPVLRRRNRRRVVFLKLCLMLIIVALLVFIFSKEGNKMEEKESTQEKIVRESAIAGIWYTANEKALAKEIDSYLSEKKYDREVAGLIVPHAGYRFSGRVAAKAYSELKGQDIKRVIILAPSHYMPFSGASICNCTHYKTPLGEVRLAEICQELVKDKELFHTYPEAHQREHSLEIQLPFLQRLLRDFEIVPIIIGPNTLPKDAKEIADALKPLVNSKTLVIASSDFTHYGPQYGYVPFRDNIQQNLKKLDNKAAEYIINKNLTGFNEFIERTGATICGHIPISILISLMDNAKGETIAYDTSGNIIGDFTNSVSYYAIGFFKNSSDSEEELTQGIKKTLIRIARETLNKHVRGENVESPEQMLNRIGKEMRLSDEEKDYLTSKKGCFVTLNKHSQLRGCIGTILPVEQLYKCIYENTFNAASRDTRFNPVGPEELEDIEIEISVLTVPKEIEYEDGEDLKNKLEPLRDGVILSKGFHKATYLPQVWEQLPDKEEFLSRLCLKAGLSQNAWKSGNLKIETYQAIVFEEKELE